MSSPSNSNRALADAIARLGGQSAMARVLGVTQAAVWKWAKRGRPLPAEHVLMLERKTGISRHDLRPDLYPREPISNARPDRTDQPEHLEQVQ